MLKIDRIKCGYKNRFHITDVSFNAQKGSFTGIIGPNGSGKTTLFKGITGELEIKEGSITLNGYDILAYDCKKRARNFAIVTQDLENAAITIEDYVLMGRLPYKGPFEFFESANDYSIAKKYLKLTGIYHLKEKYLFNLSGGEKQLAAITRALVQQPAILLLDEPTSHLDITHQMQILNLIQQLNSDLGLTVIMIVHDLNLAGEFCDNLVMMNNGTIHTTGKPEDVLTYENIEEVYNTLVVTKTNPVSGRPNVFPVSDRILKNRQKEET